MDEKKTKEIEEFVEKNFGSNKTSEIVLLVSKDELAGLEDVVKSAGITAVAMAGQHSEEGKKTIKEKGGSPDDYLTVSLIVKEEDAQRMLAHIGGFDGVEKSDRVKMVEEFMKAKSDGNVH